MSDCLGDTLSTALCLAGAASILYRKSLSSRPRATPGCAAPFNELAVRAMEGEQQLRLDFTSAILLDARTGCCVRNKRDGCWCKAVEIVSLAEKIAAEIGAKVCIRQGFQIELKSNRLFIYFF